MITQILDKIDTIRTAQKSHLIQREQEVDGIWTTLLAGEHAFLLGKPGVAKTLVIENTARRFEGAQYFSQLMHKLTPPEALFGPISLAGLKEDKYQHSTAGYLPEAHLAFLDEIFKAGPTILNALLKIMNEREFRNGTKVYKTPLLSLFAASNELPSGTDNNELAALYDRFLFRFYVEDIQTSEDFNSLLTKASEILDFFNNVPEHTISLADFQKVRRHVKDLTVTSEAIEAMVEIRDTLALKGVVVSSRRWLNSLKAIRANAVLYGEDTASVDSLTALANILWSSLEDKQVVRDVVWEYANPVEFSVRDIKHDITLLMDDMANAIKRLNKDTSTDKNNNTIIIGVEYHSKWDNLLKRLRDLKASLRETQRARFETRLDYMISVVRGAKIRMAYEMGTIDLSALNTDNIVEWKPEKV